MSNKVIISTDVGAVPTQANLATDEVGINTADAIVYVNNGSEIIPIGGLPEESILAAAMTRAEFEALQEKRIRDNAGSGFSEWGTHYTPDVTAHKRINEGMYSNTSNPNVLNMSRTLTDGATGGVSRTAEAIASVNGVQHKLKHINSSSSFDFNILRFPPAPDGTKTYDSATGDVTQHGSSNEAFEGLVQNGDFRNGNFNGWSAANIGKLSINSDGNLLASGVNSSDWFGAPDTEPFQTNTPHTCKVIAKVPLGFNMRMKTYNTTDGSPDQALFAGTGEFKEYSIEAQWTVPTGITFQFQGDGANLYDIEVASLSIMPATEQVITSRKDYVFIESWHEKISDKDQVYPLGNVQYGSTSYKGISLLARSNGYTYFGEWDTETKGYYSSWSSLTGVDKLLYVTDPENNIYLDGGDLIQVRYRIRVVEGLGDDWASSFIGGAELVRYGDSVRTRVRPRGSDTIVDDFSSSAEYYYQNTYSNPDNTQRTIGSWHAQDTAGNGIKGHNGLCFAVPIALVQRRNTGCHEPSINPQGTTTIANVTNDDGVAWWRTDAFAAKKITALSQCFDPINYQEIDSHRYNGSLGGQDYSALENVARPDKLKYDAIYASDIQDLRMSSRRVPVAELREHYKRKAIAGTVRGYEAVPFTRVHEQVQGTLGGALTVQVDSTANMSEGDNFWVWDSVSASYVKRVIANVQTDTQINFVGEIGRVAGTYVIHEEFQQHKQANPTWTEFFGEPADIVGEFPEGLEGVWNPVINTGTFNYDLARKHSVDIGIPFEQLTISTGNYINGNLGYNATLNRVALTNTADQITLSHYPIQANFTQDDVNSEVLDLGNVYATQRKDLSAGNLLQSSLTGNIGIGNSNTTQGMDSLEVGLVRRAVNNTNPKLLLGTDKFIIEHTPVILYGVGSSAVKTLDYISETDGVGKLCYAFEGMTFETIQRRNVVSVGITVNQNDVLHLNCGVPLDGHSVEYKGSVSKVIAWADYFLEGGRIVNITNGSVSSELFPAEGTLGWGDDSKIEIINNSDTTIDLNGNTVKYGTASFDTQFFIDTSSGAL